jgi:diguanylate cyclase (GGDEF)-like protein
MVNSAVQPPMKGDRIQGWTMKPVLTQVVDVTELVEKDRQSDGRRAFSITFLMGDRQGLVIPLDSVKSYTIGRSEECDIHIDEPSVSRFHAVLRLYEDGSLLISDCESRNGTFHNGMRLQNEDAIKLIGGDKLRIGKESMLRVDAHDPIDAQFQSDMYNAAVRDPMTGAYNKRYLLENVARELALSIRHGVPLSLVLFDVDHFKRINDQFGHLAGDSVLIKLVADAQRMLRTEDLLARYGGEEFAIVTKSQPLDQSLALAERLRKVIASEAFIFEGRRIPVTVSLGIASTSERPYASPEDLIQCADERLYAAKRDGRNCAKAG